MTGEVPDYRPPLRWYSHVWRGAVVLLIGFFLWAPIAEAQAEETPLLFWADIALGAVAFVLMHLRRRWPMTIAVVTSLMAPFSSWTGGPATLAMVSLATRRVRWEVVTIGLLNLPLLVLYHAVQPSYPDSGPLFLELAIGVVAIIASLGWGMFIGSRRELIRTLRQRAETAEAERDLRASQARSNERARIAREMHDVLAHRISQISMHAGALTFRDDLTADEMRTSLAVIQQKAHEALTDLREVLGVLRDEDSGTPLTGPQPTYDDIPALVDSARAAGSSIELDADLPLGNDLPDAVGRTVYRIVQEGITNAAKHAPGATLRITVGGSPERGVDVELRNPLGFGPSRTPGAGLGLVGLTERAELRGGYLVHGVEHAARVPVFVVRAWLPWTCGEEPTAATTTEPAQEAGR